MDAAVKCPACGDDSLTLIDSVPERKGGAFGDTPGRHAYRCNKCGTGTAFTDPLSHPPDWKAEKLPER